MKAWRGLTLKFRQVRACLGIHSENTEAQIPIEQHTGGRVPVVKLLCDPSFGAATQRPIVWISGQVIAPLGLCGFSGYYFDLIIKNMELRLLKESRAWAIHS